jgi:hypothetical protein
MSQRMMVFKFHNYRNLGFISRTFRRGFFELWGVAKHNGTWSFFVSLVNEQTFLSSSSVYKLDWDTRDGFFMPE